MTLAGTLFSIHLNSERSPSHCSSDSNSIKRFLLRLPRNCKYIRRSKIQRTKSSCLGLHLFPVPFWSDVWRHCSWISLIFGRSGNVRFWNKTLKCRIRRYFDGLIPCLAHGVLCDILRHHVQRFCELANRSFWGIMLQFEFGSLDTGLRLSYWNWLYLVFHQERNFVHKLVENEAQRHNRSFLNVYWNLHESSKFGDIQLKSRFLLWVPTSNRHDVSPFWIHELIDHHQMAN